MVKSENTLGLNLNLENNSDEPQVQYVLKWPKT